MTEYFYDTKTQSVTEGRTTGWENRMGPYATRDEAQQAMNLARERNEEADLKDQEW